MPGSPRRSSEAGGSHTWGFRANLRWVSGRRSRPFRPVRDARTADRSEHRSAAAAWRGRRVRASGWPRKRDTGRRGRASSCSAYRPARASGLAPLEWWRELAVGRAPNLRRRGGDRCGVAETQRKTRVRGSPEARAGQAEVAAEAAAHGHRRLRRQRRARSRAAADDRRLRPQELATSARRWLSSAAACSAASRARPRCSSSPDNRRR
jgi:hypothetical protein